MLVSENMGIKDAANRMYEFRRQIWTPWNESIEASVGISEMKTKWKRKCIDGTSDLFV